MYITMLNVVIMSVSTVCVDRFTVSMIIIAMTTITIVRVTMMTRVDNEADSLPSKTNVYHLLVFRQQTNARTITVCKITRLTNR